MNNTQAQSVVVGAGAVGCAVAHELAAAGLAPLVLEKENASGRGVTSRNSGVIHSGLYYKPNSLKSQSCIRGNALLYEWCNKYLVPHKKTGKWIIAKWEECDKLEHLHINAQKSGVRGLQWHGRAALIRELREFRCDKAIFCTETGIVDATAFTQSLQQVAQQSGATFVFSTFVKNVHRQREGFTIETSRGLIQTNILVNCAGLYADEIAPDKPAELIAFPCRGDYFRIPGKYPQLVYPVYRGGPGLGVHLTIDLEQNARLGPDAYYVESKEDFSPPKDLDGKRQLFFQAAQKILRSITLEDLQYDSCGIRPKLRSPLDAKEKDFVITSRNGLIQLFGIESPGLTAALDLAQRVRSMLVGGN